MKKLIFLSLILLIILIAGCAQQPTGQFIGSQGNKTNPNQIQRQETSSTPVPQQEQNPQPQQSLPLETTQSPLEKQPKEECIEDWSCSSWGECSNLKQTRTCVDLNSCGATINKPFESQSCTPPITCTNECSYTGEKDCLGNYTQVCGNYDEDKCLELKKDRYCEYGCLSGICQQSPEEKYIVSYAIDGDTFVLTNGEKIRLIGINAPESGQSCYSEAKNKLNELIDNKEVFLEKDISNEDMYERLLRYVYIDNLFVNLEMVRLGYANAYEYPPDIKYSVQIAEAENEAKTNQYGCIWRTSIYSDCFSIMNFHYDAEGNDNYNLNDEYLTLKNICDFSIDMTRWTVKDEATHIYTFPNFSLGSENTATLYSGTGTNTDTKLYWGRSYGAVWNNDGDTFYLRDVDGSLVLTYSY